MIIFLLVRVLNCFKIVSYANLRASLKHILTERFGLLTDDHKGPIVYYVPPGGEGDGVRGGYNFQNHLKGGYIFL